MKRYDPLVPPDPVEWMDLPEPTRLRLVEDYHRRIKSRAPSVAGHSALHVAVEKQVALGDEIPVRRVLLRLLDQGLDRHDAIHAVAAVLAGHMHDLVNGKIPPDIDPNEPYYEKLDRLTAERWRNRDWD
jgi:hypothetical protein